MFSFLHRYKDEFVDVDGGYALVLVDALLLIPLMFAAFFYPFEVLIGVGVALLVAAAVFELYVHWRRRARRRAAARQ